MVADHESSELMPDPWNDTWTLTHDLALLFVALAYGTDRKLSDEEADVIMQVLETWDPDASVDTIREVIVEAMSVLVDTPAPAEVDASIVRLGEALSEDELTQVLEEVNRIARADGILLRREEHLIGRLAEAWSLRGLETDPSTAPGDDWELIHQMAFLYVIVAHSTDNELSPVEIEAIINRLREWDGKRDEATIRDVLRDAITYYAQEPGEDVLEETIVTIRNSLPPMRRLILLDDLYYIAHADGTFTANEREMITSLAAAWGLSIRLNGSAPSA